MKELILLMLVCVASCSINTAAVKVSDFNFVLCSEDYYKMPDKTNHLKYLQYFETMENKYGTVKDIYEKLVQITKGETVDIPKMFWSEYGLYFMDTALILYKEVDFKIIKLLLEKSVSPNNKIIGMTTPMMTSIQYGRTEAINLFYEKSYIQEKCYVDLLLEYASLIDDQLLIKTLDLIRKKIIVSK